MDDRLIGWKKQSIENSRYKCVITGDIFDHIHHLYSFSSIVNDAFEELGLSTFQKQVSKYSSEELFSISDKIIEIHYRYPLGVCLRRDVHEKFHKIYGKSKNTPEQFYCFMMDIKNGKIKI
jgi:hypothetical protein